MGLHEAVRSRATRLEQDNPGAIVSVLDRLGVVKYASPSTQSLLGFAPDERIGRASSHFIAPADVDHATLAFQDAVLNGESVCFGMAFVTKNGARLPVRCTLYAMLDTDADELFVIAKSVPIES